MSLDTINSMLPSSSSSSSGVVRPCSNTMMAQAEDDYVSRWSCWNGCEFSVFCFIADLSSWELAAISLCYLVGLAAGLLADLWPIVLWPLGCVETTQKRLQVSIYEEFVMGPRRSRRGQQKRGNSLQINQRFFIDGPGKSGHSSYSLTERAICHQCACQTQCFTAYVYPWADKLLQCTIYSAKVYFLCILPFLIYSLLTSLFVQIRVWCRLSRWASRPTQATRTGRGSLSMNLGESSVVYNCS